MNWKIEAIDKLKKYNAIRQSTELIPEQIRMLENEALALKLKKDNGALMNNLAERKELEVNLNRSQDFVRLIDKGFSVLDPEERLILHRLYICPELNGIRKLCDELDIEQSTVYRKREQALLKFTRALYGIVEAV